MAIWRKDEPTPVVTEKRVTGQVLLPPLRVGVAMPNLVMPLGHVAVGVVHGLHWLWKSLRLLLFFVLLTLRPLVRILFGLISGFSLLGCAISFAIAWSQNWRSDLLWATAGMFAAAVVCSALLWQYDMILLRRAPEVSI
ncbi:MAG: hypothetical protein ACRD4H_05760 [Candidatus Acidiferrales bacterium]